MLLEGATAEHGGDWLPGTFLLPGHQGEPFGQTVAMTHGRV